MTDLVVVSLEVWDEVWRRNQHLIAGLLRSGAARRVLFVEPPRDTLHQIRRGDWPGRGEIGLRRISLEGSKGDLWALRPHKTLPRKIDPGGDVRRARKVAAVTRQLGMGRPVLWVNDPGGAEILGITGWPALYDITDDWLVADRPAAALARLHRQEAQLFDQCAQVVVCSPALKRTKSQQRDVVLIPNAVDLEPYRALQPRPDDLPTGPVALYLGTAHRDRIDVDLVVDTAESLARISGTIVLVGPSPLPREDLDRLQHAGVVVLGPRPSHTVPSYLQHADVLLVPHVLTDFTASLDPIKAYEYRAAARRVVSTPVPGFLSDDRTRVLVGEEFVGAVVEFCSSHDVWATPDLHDVPTWAMRTRAMADVINGVAATSA